MPGKESTALPRLHTFPTSLPLATQNHENIFNESGELGHLFGISEEVLKLGVHFMAKADTTADLPVAKSTTAKPPYTFRTAWALLLLAINFLVAAYYFHIIE